MWSEVCLLAMVCLATICTARCSEEVQQQPNAHDEAIAALTRVCGNEQAEGLSLQQVDSIYEVFTAVFSDQKALFNAVADHHANFKEKAEFPAKKPVNMQPRTKNQIKRLEEYARKTKQAVEDHTKLLCGMYGKMKEVYEQMGAAD